MEGADPQRYYLDPDTVRIYRVSDSFDCAPLDWGLSGARERASRLGALAFALWGANADPCGIATRRLVKRALSLAGHPFSCGSVRSRLGIEARPPRFCAGGLLLRSAEWGAILAAQATWLSFDSCLQ